MNESIDEDILASLTNRWDELLRGGQELEFHEGQVLFYEGHVPYGAFVLLEGDVEFRREGIPSDKSHRIKSPNGEIIGLGVIAGEAPYCCTCTATGDCRVIFISKTQLLPLLGKEL